MITSGASCIKESGDIAGIAPLVLVDEQQVGPPPPHLTLAFITLTMLAQLGEAFCQQRTALRAWRMAVGQALTLGSRTISRIIASLQRDQRDWSADYRLFSRSPWQTRALFVPVLREALSAALPPHVTADAPIWVAGDHTHLRKTGRHIAGVHTIRDPMSPPWHVNLISGLRFFHLAVMVAPWRQAGQEGEDVPARAIPVRFEPSPTVKKPGKKATPEQIAIVRTGGREHAIRYKERAAYWQGGAGRRGLRVIVIAPTGYRLHQKGPLLYRQPAYLLTTDLKRGAQELIQGYVDRWQIEVAHCELKDGFGIQDSQVRHEKSVPRHPGFEVAVYAMLHLAALKAHGPRRTKHYMPPPKWYAGGVRPSLLDIVQLLRVQIPQCPSTVLPPDAAFISTVLTEKAAA